LKGTVHSNSYRRYTDSSTVLSQIWSLIRTSLKERNLNSLKNVTDLTLMHSLPK
jgi:hypothetical protein